MAPPAVVTTPLPTLTPDTLTLTGRIVDTAKKPLAGIYVSGETAGAEQATKTAADGSFALMLTKARWCFFALTPIGQIGFSASGWTWSGSDVCIDIGSKRYAIDLVVPDGALVSGKVLDRRGKPVANADLSATPDEGAKGYQNDVITNATGRFSIRLLPGRYYLLVENSNDQMWSKVTVGKKAITGLTLLPGGGGG
jgi:hypothetical protein